MNNETVVAYVPVIHRGYLEFFKKVCPGTICVLSDDVLRSLPKGLEYIYKKDAIRAIPPEVMVSILANLFHEDRIGVVLADESALLRLHGEQIVMPDEDISSALSEKYFSGEDVKLVPTTKLRYHRNNVEEKKLLVPSRRIELSDLDREMMEIVEGVAVRSPDWYRQVGGALATKNKLIVGYNEHVPHEQVASTFGDPRSIFKSGVRTDLSLGDHCEHVLIGEAARLGISTDGSSLYITDFPCLPCSRLAVRAGVKKIFYRNPSYGLLDADQYLRIKKVELIEVSE